jgi:hypothetical protein
VRGRKNREKGDVREFGGLLPEIRNAKRESGMGGYAHVNEMPGGMVQVLYSGRSRSLDKEHASAFSVSWPQVFNSLCIFNFDSFHSSFL